MKPMLRYLVFSLTFSTALSLTSPGQAASPVDEQAELAKQVQNPIASLISVPIQNNWDFGIGSANAMRYTANIQPVIPFSLNHDWNVITRMIMPIIYAESPVKGGRDKSGLGDILQSFFFSPKAPVHGWILGAGPALQYPSATDNALGSEKWSAGPTAVALRQQDGWTYGALLNHLWSYTGTSHRRNVNGTFLQPFLAYTTKTPNTISCNVPETNWARYAPPYVPAIPGRPKRTTLCQSTRR